MKHPLNPWTTQPRTTQPRDHSTQGPLNPGPLIPGPLKPESSMGPLYLPPWTEVLNNIAGELHMVVVRKEISGECTPANFCPIFSCLSMLTWLSLEVALSKALTTTTTNGFIILAVLQIGHWACKAWIHSNHLINKKQFMELKLTQWPSEGGGMGGP